MQRSIASDVVKAFVLAGQAVFTLVSKDGNRRDTYMLSRAWHNKSTYYCKRLYGPDNTRDYTLVGFYYSDTNNFVPIRSYKYSPEYAWPPYVRMLKHFLTGLDKGEREFTVYHEGKCARCGKILTTPESIELGFGPKCYKEIEEYGY